MSFKPKFSTLRPVFSAQLHTQTNKDFHYLKVWNQLKFIILDDHLNLLDIAYWILCITNYMLKILIDSLLSSLFLYLAIC